MSAREALKIFAESSCGDVLAARCCAIALLADVQTSGSGLAAERLLFTAALLHLQCETAETPLTLSGLSSILTGLSIDGATRRAFARSPSLFVQYVAAAAEDGELGAPLLAARTLLLTCSKARGS